MTLFEDFLYWTDWESKAVLRCHKNHCSNVTHLVRTSIRPMDLQVMHPLRQRPRESSGRAARGRPPGKCLRSFPTSFLERAVRKLPVQFSVLDTSCEAPRHFLRLCQRL